VTSWPAPPRASRSTTANALRDLGIAAEKAGLNEGDAPRRPSANDRVISLVISRYDGGVRKSHLVLAGLAA
jgi:hypothetical protein